MYKIVTTLPQELSIDNIIFNIKPCRSGLLHRNIYNSEIRSQASFHSYSICPYIPNRHYFVLDVVPLG